MQNKRIVEERNRLMQAVLRPCCGQFTFEVREGKLGAGLSSRRWLSRWARRWHIEGQPWPGGIFCSSPVDVGQRCSTAAVFGGGDDKNTVDRPARQLTAARTDLLMVRVGRSAGSGRRWAILALWPVALALSGRYASLIQKGCWPRLCLPCTSFSDDAPNGGNRSG